MRFLLSIVFTGLLVFLGGLVFPWWWLAVASFLVAIVWPQHPFKSFMGGLMGGLITWFVLALIADSANDQILSTRMAAVFSLSKPFMLVIITGAVGGIVAGMAALSAALLRSRVGTRPAA